MMSPQQARVTHAACALDTVTHVSRVHGRLIHHLSLRLLQQRVHVAHERVDVRALAVHLEHQRGNVTLTVRGRRRDPRSGALGENG